MHRNYHAANASMTIYRIKTSRYVLRRRFDALVIVNPASQFCEINATMPGYVGDLIQNRKPGPVGQSKIPPSGVRDNRLCHLSNLFMVSGVSKNKS